MIFLLTVALEVTAFEASVTSAIESKRLHGQLYPDTVTYEGVCECIVN